MTRRSGGHLPFRPDIEGLRALAIIAVVLYHAGVKSMPGGFYGVDVFFVLSGFLITGIIVDEIVTTGRLGLGMFWARRARRLLPAATVVTLLVLVMNAQLFSLFVQINLAKTAEAFAVYGSNILFAVRSTDYFGGVATRDPLLHTWSLSVEEQFYLFFAPAMLLLAWLTRRAGAEGFRRWFRLGAVVVTVLSFAGCLLLVRRYPVIAFYGLPARAWEFGLGALALLAVPRAAALTKSVRDAIALVSLAAIVYSVVMLGGAHHESLGAASLLPTLGTVGLILSGAGGAPTFVGALFSTSPLRLLGRLSYSWYLWHWPALLYLRASVPGPSLAMMIAVAVGSLLPAAAMYALVETPVRYSTFLQRNTRWTLVGAVVVAALTFGAAAFAIRRADATLHTPAVIRILEATKLPRIYDDGCQVSLLATESPTCEYGPARNDTTIVVFGDSHAAHWFPAFDSVASLRGWRLVNWTKTGCPSSGVTVLNLGRRYFECDEWRAKIVARIVALRPTIVVVVNDKTYSVVVGNDAPDPDSSAVAREQWRAGLVKTMRSIQPSGARVIFLGDTPQPASDIPQCLVRYVGDPSRCDVPTSRGINPPVTAMERAAAHDAHVAYMNLNEFICDDRTCPATKDGIIRYQDSNHLSVAFAASLAPQLSQALTQALTARAP
ncbi:MAG: acyltransferase family protein [Gemmatimonadaceae bacterium]